MGKKKIFLIVGRTCTGKTVLAREVAKRVGLKVVKSYTTRPMRENETCENSDHYFIKHEDVQQYVDEMAAYTIVGDDEYFTTKGELDQSDLYVIDPKGVEDLKNRCGNEYDFITIYIRTSKRCLIQRADKRGKQFDYNERYMKENEQFSDFETEMPWDYHILNDGEFELAATTMEKMVRKELNLWKDGK